MAAILFRPWLCAPHIRRVGAHKRHGYWKLGSACDLDSNTANSAVYWRAPQNCLLLEQAMKLSQTPGIISCLSKNLRNQSSQLKIFISG